MEPLKLLSLGAIALAVCSCVVVYIQHRRTTARLDALTQANIGITQTLHQLIASSMPRPQSQLQMQPRSEMIPGEADNVNEVTRVIDDSGSTEKMSNTGRIVVSDDESSGSNSSESSNFCDGSEDDDASDDSIDKNTDDDGSDTDIDDEVKEDVSNKQEFNLQHTSSVAKQVEELSDNDESDDGSDDESDDGSNDESDDESDEGENKIALIESVVAIDSDDISNIAVGGESQPVEEGTAVGDNVDLVAFLLPQTDNKNIDIGIMPISSNHSGLVPYENETPISDGFKQMKVEELRKLIVSKLGMTDDEAKKLKKPQLIQKLSESHE